MIGPKKPRPTPTEERKGREIVKGRDGGVCVKCGRGHGGVNFDHRQNASQGGFAIASNGQLLCGSGTTGCHGWKTENPEQAIDEGWGVPGYADPREWPARRYFATAYGTSRLGWCLYTDGGRVIEISQAEAIARMESQW